MYVIILTVTVVAKVTDVAISQSRICHKNLQMSQRSQLSQKSRKCHTKSQVSQMSQMSQRSQLSQLSQKSRNCHKSRKCHKKSQMSQKVAKVANVKVHSKTPNCIVCISGFYTGWLLPAAVVGVMVFLYGVFTMNSNTIAVETCSKGDEYRMCPLCEECDYWKLIDICLYKRIAYLFDHPGTVFYAIFMSFWGKTHSILLLSL